MIVTNIKKTINGKIILNNISFSINANNKIGLVGINGSGKSTLLKILSGNIKQDSGNIKLNNQSVGYLKQEIPHSFDEYSILEYIKEETKIAQLENKLHKLELNLNKNNMDEYSKILNKFLTLDGYNFENNLKKIINGLNVNETLDKKIKILSGGEKIKILLATLLLKNDDILLLDEPTNNLDIEAINWLENYLKSCSKKIIIVSHDEVFLNNTTNKIFELNNGKITEYNLSYSDYLIEKEYEYSQKLNEYNKVQEKKIKLQKQLVKVKEWNNKGLSKKANNDNDKIANNFAKEKTKSSNISKITKDLNNLEMPYFEEKKHINFLFNFDNRKGNKNIILNNLECGYENFKTPKINIDIPFGTRINIIGKNGSGKTTLIKTILNEIPIISGELKIGKDIKIGYISQDTLNNENNDTLLDYLIKDKENIDLSFIFVLLDKFNIDYNDKDKLYNNLSPGERTRVNLVKIALDKINTLILDEVTNHLDKEAIDLIYELINNYQGSIISVSHNRKYNEILNPDIDLNIEDGTVTYNEKHK